MSNRSFEVSADHAVLGRDASCQIVLPDPERVVSGRHVRFERENGAWSLTDTSTNGTYHNQPSNILNSGERIALSDGDLLGIGNFEVKIEIVPEISDNKSVASESDPNDRRIEPMLVPSGDKPINQQIDRQTPSGDEGVPALFRDFLSESESASPSPEPKADTPKPNSDPIQPAKSDDAARPINADVPPVGFNPFVESPLSADKLVAPQRDDIPAHHEPFTPSAITPPANDSNACDLDPFDQPNPFGDAADDPFVQKDSSPDAGSDASADLAIAAFGRGLGVNVGSTHAGSEKLFETAGSLIREYTQGLIELNNARNEIKREFGLATTEMQALGNNSVKFSANLEDALAKLFTEQGDAFLEPADSVQSAHRDVLAHQMALLSALRHSLHDLVERFNPDTLQSTELDESSVFDKVGLVKDDSRNWKRFLEVYEEVASDSENDFLRVLGESIQAAYHNQIRELPVAEVAAPDKPNNQIGFESPLEK